MNEEILEIIYVSKGRILCLTPNRVIVARGGLGWSLSLGSGYGHRDAEEEEGKAL